MRSFFRSSVTVEQTAPTPPEKSVFEEMRDGLRDALGDTLAYVAHDVMGDIARVNEELWFGNRISTGHGRSPGPPQPAASDPSPTTTIELTHAHALHAPEPDLER